MSEKFFTIRAKFKPENYSMYISSISEYFPAIINVTKNEGGYSIIDQGIIPYNIEDIITLEATETNPSQSFVEWREFDEGTNGYITLSTESLVNIEEEFGTKDLIAVYDNEPADFYTLSVNVVNINDVFISGFDIISYNIPSAEGYNNTPELNANDLIENYYDGPINWIFVRWENISSLYGGLVGDFSYNPTLPSGSIDANTSIVLKLNDKKWN